VASVIDAFHYRIGMMTFFAKAANLGILAFPWSLDETP
jgi:hypothetical protein